MADISALGNLNPVSQPLDDERYADAKPFQLPIKGRYTLRARESFPQEAFGSTKNGDLSATIDPVIVGPKHEGFQLRFTRVSAKPYGSDENGKPKVSQMGLYLRACGIKETISSPQQMANTVEATAGRIFEAELDWRAYNKATGKSLKGMKNFPSDGNGGYQSYFIDPDDTDDQGQPKRVLANVEIVRFYPAG